MLSSINKSTGAEGSDGKSKENWRPGSAAQSEIAVQTLEAVGEVES
jgi:hypothetical protein